MGSSLTTGRNQLHYVELDKSNIALNPGKYDHAGRQVPGCTFTSGETRITPGERPAFTEEQIRTETARCPFLRCECGRSEQMHWLRIVHDALRV